MSDRSSNYLLVVRGSGFTSESPTKVAALVDQLFCVDPDGLIARIVDRTDDDFDALAEGAITLGQGEYLLPGFIDLHVHAPQWPQAGTALDAPLEDWLQTYTFPLEARFTDARYARRVYADLVNTLLANGTTTAMYFGSKHVEATLELARICAARGQRALIGKVVMDDPATTPEYYRDADAASAITETAHFIDEVRKLPQTFRDVHPLVIPRFVPSCTDEALAGLGRLASDLDVRVHSHASESQWEHDFVLERFGASDAAVLHRFGLLKRGSVFAHCTHLSNSDVDLFASYGAAIAHCPISNAYFAGAVLPLRRFRKWGVVVGLGTDISGGFSPSIYANLAQAAISSRMLADQGVPDARITLAEAFHAATSAGGRALGLPIGQLAKGYSFDAQVVSAAPDFGGLPHTAASRFERLLLRTGPEQIRRVWVAGREVVNRGPAPAGHFR